MEKRIGFCLFLGIACLFQAETIGGAGYQGSGAAVISTSVTLIARDRLVKGKAELIDVRVAPLSSDAFNGAAVSLYEPASKLYWWTLQWSTEAANLGAIQNDLAEYRFAIDQDRIIGFLAFGRSLWIRASSEKFDSEESANESILSTLPTIAPKVRSGALTLFQEIDLVKPIGVIFFEPSDLSVRRQRVRVENVSWLETGWDVQLSNEQGQRRTITLGEKYEVLRVREP